MATAATVALKAAGDSSAWWQATSVCPGSHRLMLTPKHSPVADTSASCEWHADALADARENVQRTDAAMGSTICEGGPA